MNPLKNYDLLTAENTCKWAKVDEDEPHFARCDVALEFAQGCQMEFRYHTLVWGAEGALPPWLQPGNPEYGNWTAEEKRQGPNSIGEILGLKNHPRPLQDYV